jgi:hypothetical protein
MNIFISYRRAEDNKSYIVGTIHEKLAKAFGKEEVFRDTYDIAGGTDWRTVLEREINSCRVMLVIIGPDWANLAYSNGEKRLFDPQDVTRWEVETGLRRSSEGSATIIPVLVTGADIPKLEELPESLHPLLDKNVVSIRNFPDFEPDMEKLVRDIRSSQGFREDDIKIADFEPKTIYIEEGLFLMGSLPAEGIPQHETPQHEVTLSAYRIGKYPVTNVQYEKFVNKTDRLVKPVMGWEGRNVPDGLGENPVLGVTWYDALEYCKWLSSETGRKYILPNEAHLEKAYKGSYGCSDIIDNIYLWTCTLWGEKGVSPDLKYRYPWKDDGRNNLSANGQIRRVVCGYKKIDNSKSFQRHSRTGQFPDEVGLSGARHSFRVVMAV